MFIEERNNKWNTPYLFNAKELDEETGLYYYGARYYDSRASVWLSTDPLQEKYPNISTYAYCVQNPIKFIDPDGREDVNGPYDPNVGKVVFAGIKLIIFGDPNYKGSGKYYHGSRQASRWILGIDNTASGIFGAMAVSLFQFDEIELHGKAIEKMKADPSMVAAEQTFISNMNADEGFAKNGVFKDILNVQFGPARDGGDGSGGWTLGGGFDAATTELTWLVRNADVEASAIRDNNGKITITYSLSPQEKLDVRPNGSEDMYDKVTKVVGPVYHDLLGGNDQIRTKATWTTTIESEKND